MDTKLDTKLERRRFGVKSILLSDGTRIDAHFANNRGRASDNVTLTRVAMSVGRARQTRGYHAREIISQTRTVGWRGVYRLTDDVLRRLDVGESITEA